ncbi:MAG TPA: zf-HC2 domain-containing protein [Anaeromyxobacteraceae bacterium]|nr:zf-HC2 domain-containing protein [Anaeromyxobacteraceae bacterium]
MNHLHHLTEDEAQLHLEGALDESVQQGVDAHLAGCPECQALVLSFSALADALSDLPVAEPPPDFTAGVMARIEEQEATRAAERRLTVAVFGAVAVSLAVTLVLAGQAAWAPALSAVSSGAVQALQAFRISADVLSPLVSALRIQIIVATAALGIPLLLALSRLASPRQGRQAA